MSARRLRQPDVVRLGPGLYRRRSETPPSPDRPHPDRVWRDLQIAQARTLASSLAHGQFYAGFTAAAIWELPVPHPIRRDDARAGPDHDPGRGSRTRHSRLLGELLPLLSTHSASPPESHLRLRIREWGLPEPELDYDVRAANGVLLGCSEFAWPRYRLAAEYEGDHHRTESPQWNRDIEKYHSYERHGWEAVRATSLLLYRQQPELRHRLTGALRDRGWEGR